MGGAKRVVHAPDKHLGQVGWVVSRRTSFSPAVLASVEVLTAGAHGEDAAATTALSALLAFGIPLCGLVAVLRRVPALATVVRGG